MKPRIKPLCLYSLDQKASEEFNIAVIGLSKYTVNQRWIPFMETTFRKLL